MEDKNLYVAKKGDCCDLSSVEVKLLSPRQRLVHNMSEITGHGRYFAKLLGLSLKRIKCTRKNVSVCPDL
jgi:hypothetical protein